MSHSFQKPCRGRRRATLRRNGTSIVEYSVMLAMIVLLAIASIIATGESSSDFYDYNAAELNSALNE